MNTRHALIALTSATLLAACAVGAGGADTGDVGGDDSTGAGTNTTGAGGTTGVGPGSTTGAGAGTTTTSGTGGAPTTTGVGAGTTTSGSGGTNSSSASTSSSSSTASSTSATSSSSSGGGTCAHDVCSQGIALTPGCGDPCVDTVCSSDSYCCTNSWDSVCVDEADQLCGACTMVGTVQPGDLVITEIMNNPSAVADADGEWFELYNDAPYPIDLQGLDINHTANDPSAVHTIASSVVVPSGGYVVLGINSNSSTNGGVTVDYQYSGVSLNNTVDYVAIVDGNTVIDQVTYDEASGLDPAGASRTLDPLYLSALQNDTDTNFCTASSMMAGGDAGTPGAANDNCP